MGVSGRSPLVGRVAERSVLAARVASLAAGRGGLVWVTGEPGIGKTALVEAMAEQARQAGCEVARSGADELMEAFPLRLMADCLGVSRASAEPLAVEIARILRGDDVGGVVDAVLAASERLVELVDVRCARAPMLLVAEDLQWADEPSLLAWNRLSRAVGQIPLLLVGTCRSSPARPVVRALAGLAAERDAVVLDLGPLAPDEVGQIAAGLVGPPGPTLTNELGRAGGNPFYVRELVEALSREQLLGAGPDGQVDLVSPIDGTPQSLSAMIGSRLRFLSDDTLRVLRSVALLGGEFSAAQWATVTGQSVGQIAADVHQAAAGGVLEASGERLRFRHELIRQVLVEQTPAGVRAVMQVEFARQLAGAGFDIDVVAQQLLTAGDRMPPWAVAWLAQLPESRLYPALGVSAQLLRRAHASVPAGSSEWQPIAVRLALVLFWLGQRGEAGRVAEDVVAHTTEPVLSARMRVIASRCAHRRGDFQHSFQLTVVADQDLPDQWRARLLAWNAMALRFFDEPEQPYDRAVESMRIARQSGDPLSIGHALLVLLCCARDRGEYLDAGLDEPPGTDPESLELYAKLLDSQMSLQFALGERAAFERTERRWHAFADRVGLGQYASAIGMAAVHCYEYGRWDDVLVYTDSLAEKILSDTPRSSAFGAAYRVALHREQPQLAARYLDATRYGGIHNETATGDNPTGDSTSSHPDEDFNMFDIRALQAAARGDRADELQWRRKLLAAPRWVLKDNWPDILRLLCVALELDDSATVAAVLEICREAPDVMYWHLATRCCRALVDDDTAELLALAEEFRAKGWTLVYVEILEEAAVRLARAGSSDAARSAFTDVVGVYDALGSNVDVRRASARMRPYGIRYSRRSSHRRASTGWAALTPAEQRVARLAAQGLSNPDIAKQLYLSRNTVQCHVSSILTKLILRSRVQLRDAVPDA
jgi:DNA-binding NarL/FixJ family response regulator